jgi:hypothetical protein
MIILIDTDEKLIEVDHNSDKVLTFNTLAELLMVFNKYSHISLEDYKKNTKVNNKLSSDIKPTEPNLKR